MLSLNIINGQPEHREHFLARKETICAKVFQLYSDCGPVRVTRVSVSVDSLSDEEVQLSIIMFQLQSTQCSYADKLAFQIVYLSNHNLQQPRAYIKIQS